MAWISYTRPMRIQGAAVCVCFSLAASAADADVSRSEFGKLDDGRTVESIVLSNHQGLRARIITYGATLQSFQVPDRAGRMADVVLGYGDLASYAAKREFFGATVGRVANRIAEGKFTLDGHVYTLTTNSGPNTLHGGKVGFDKMNWTIVGTESAPFPSVTLRYVSPGGEGGFPGTLTATATYSLNDRNELQVEYLATSDAPTVVNLTNHTFWNLGGEGSAQNVLQHLLMIPADRFTPVDANLIPTGELRPVAGTPFDFRSSHAIGRDIREVRDLQIVYGKGYDHNWVIGESPTAEPRLVARVEDPASGRVLEVLSNQPGLQFYTANSLSGERAGKSGRSYRQSDGFALEPQLFPDVVNRPAFGSARLDPGGEYRNLIVFRMSVARRHGI